MAAAWQHPWEDPRGHMMLHSAVEGAPGEEGDTRVPGSCWETAWPMSPACPLGDGEGGGSSRSAVFGRRASSTLSTAPRDGGAASARHETQHAPVPVLQRRRMSLAGPGLLRWCAPQEDPADNSCQLTAPFLHPAWTGSLRRDTARAGEGAPRAGQGWTPSAAGAGTAQTPRARDQAEQVATSVPCTDNFRLSAYFELLHQKLRLLLPLCMGCPALGLPQARASHSLQPGAPERWGLASGALGWGKVLNMGKLQ